MLFNSGIFLGVFLPLTLAVYYIAIAFFSKRSGLLVLTVASLFFYGWWDYRYVPLILGSVAVNYLFAKWLAGRPRRFVLSLGCVFNLGLLGAFKYADFFIGNTAVLLGASFLPLNIILPLGISFFTFQQIAFLVDTYKGKARPDDGLSYILFVIFFPQLIAGPIVHHASIVPQYMRGTDVRKITSHLSIGLTIFAFGLFKKIFIADELAIYATGAFSAAAHGGNITLPLAWTGLASYALQIYFDFSAYSDMALGLGRMFGFRIPINFNSPYKAASIIDFWRRWHITLSRFLKDYLYIPLGGSRLGPSRHYLNVMIVMLLGGLWHGASWLFVIWGGIHGAAIIINHLWRQHLAARIRLPRIAGHVLTLLTVLLAWVFFRADSLEAAMRILQGLADISSAGARIPAETLVLIAAGFGWVLFAPNTAQFFAPYLSRTALVKAGVEPYRIIGSGKPLFWVPRKLYAFSAGLVFLLIVTNLWKSSEFIYFQF